MKKKTWYTKKYTRWTGADMLKGVLTITGIGTLLCSLPFVGYLIKEALD